MVKGEKKVCSFKSTPQGKF